MDNTYKVAWARALAELCVEHSPRQDYHFDEFAALVFKYYWNQSIFFGLQQGPSANRRPEIHAMVLQAIDEYQLAEGLQPRTFIEVAQTIDLPVQSISTVLAQDVCKRFVRLDKRVIDTYEFDLKQRTIRVKHPQLIKEHADILFQLINYRWAQKLEDIDGSPRIAKKIKGVDREQVPKRVSLAEFKTYLDAENPEKVCFLTGKSIADGDDTIDHVIPWSYLYADNLWNLVYVDRRENSSKGNRIADEATIMRLESRNRRLSEALQQQGDRFL
jgi:5-methylcytosine-specific restriction endonuclease McrA